MTLLPDVDVDAPVAYCPCGRRLTRPSSIRQGQGDVCWAKTHTPLPRVRLPRRRAVMAAPAPRTTPPQDGQLALDLDATEGQR